MRKPFWISFCLAALFLGASPAAQAGTAAGQFNVGLTVVAQGHGVAVLRNANYTPGASASVLAGLGFHDITLLQRGPTAYVFRANRGAAAAPYVVTVAVWQGRVLTITRA